MAAKRIVLALAAAVLALSASAIDASNRYRSPRNPERRIRASTSLIVLHTTEAPARSSLNKVSERGECHYCVTEDGTVYRIVDRDREAFHAGRSMWNGREDVDKFSIGIEVVGNHDKAMPLAQLRSLRDLVRELKGMYSLSDDKVVPHSAVAYGSPNRWHRSRHRGRKRCGMLFAMPSVRRVLGLASRPAYDPDTRARRLSVGDVYLEKVLYGSTDLFRSVYGAATIASVAPSADGKKGLFSWFRKPFASGTAAGRAPPTLRELKAKGYVCRGTVTKNRPASKIVGSKWNAADTYYVIRTNVVPGTAVNPARIEAGTAIWTKGR